MCVEREVREESFEQRRDWDQARHEEQRVNLGLSTDAVRVSIARPSFGRPDVHVSLSRRLPLHPPLPMSENGSSSSLPTSPVTAVPDSPARRIRKFARDNSQRRGPASVVSETTEGNGDYFGSANLPFSFSSASLTLSAVPQEWSSSKHGFHGQWLSGLAILWCLYHL